MNLERQTYIDVDYPLADVPTGFAPDFFQPKYDGIWAHVSWDGVADEATITSRTGKLKGTILVPNSVKRLGRFDIVAEYLVSQQRAVNSPDYGKLRCFDLVRLGDNMIEQVSEFNLASSSYKNRYATLKNLLETDVKVHDKWLLTPCYHMQHLPAVWQKHVESKALEGVVYRRWDQTYNQPLHRSKLEVMVDMIIVGMVEGQGKYAGSLGALQLRYYDDDDLVVEASGMDDLTRHRMWAYRDSYLHKVAELSCKGVFDSGSLRHPQFVRLRDDKLPSECTKPKTSKS